MGTVPILCAHDESTSRVLLGSVQGTQQECIINHWAACPPEPASRRGHVRRAYDTRPPHLMGLSQLRFPPNFWISVFATRVKHEGGTGRKIIICLAYFIASIAISPRSAVSLLMEIISRQMRPAITRINGITNWPKRLRGIKTTAQGWQNSQATVPLHLLPHFHYHTFPFFRIAWLDK